MNSGRILTLGFGLFLVGIPSQALVPEAGVPGGVEPWVRVRVGEWKNTFEIRGYDLVFQALSTRAPAFVGSKSKTRPHRFTANRSTEWKMDCPGSGRVRLTLASDPSIRYEAQSPVRVESPSGFVRIEDRPFRSQVFFYAIKGGGCEAVNKLPIEKYLEGLVNSEFNSRWNRDAIDAQVVAARTYAYHELMEAKKRPAEHFDLESTTKDQVYEGAQKEDFLAAQSVSRTRGQILTTRSSVKPMKAYYHSTCGGETALPEEVWGKAEPGFERKVACPYCKTSPAFSWEGVFSKKTLIERVLAGLKFPKFPFPTIGKSEMEFTLTAFAKKGGRRIQEVLLSWNGGLHELKSRIPAQKFRLWVGPVELKSTNFEIFSLNGDSVVFRGRGYGHGVGMCQWGAKEMGSEGFNARKILSHYYPDAVVRRTW